jgi:hypothetical protein
MNVLNSSRAMSHVKVVLKTNVSEISIIRVNVVNDHVLLIYIYIYTHIYTSLSN